MQIRAALIEGASIGLAVSSVLWGGMAVAGESVRIVDVASVLPAHATTLPDVQSDAQFDETPVPGDAAIQTAQLEWLFGQLRQPEPPRQPELRQLEPRRLNGKRYIRVRSLDEFGNPVTRRMLTATKRAERKTGKNDWSRRSAGEKLRNALQPPPTNGPLLITVSLAHQQITLYDRGIAVAQSPISSGMPGHATPTGVFSVIQKQYFHRSNIYSAAPMPYMQRLTWSGIAMHGGVLPGYAASHGCIRLPEQFAIRLWGTTQPGVRVIVTRGQVKPVEIAHAALFVPKAKDAPAIAPPIAPPSPAAPPLPAEPPQGPQVEHDIPASPVDTIVANIAADKVASPIANKDASAVVSTDASPIANTDDSAVASGDDGDAAPVSLMEKMESTVPAVAEITIVRGGQSQPDLPAPASYQVAEPSVSGSKSGVHTRSITIVRGGEPMAFQTVDMPPVAVDTVVPSPLSEKRGATGQVADVIDVDEDEIGDETGEAPELPLPSVKNQPVVLAYSGGDFMQFAARAQRRAEAEQAVGPSAAAQEAYVPRPGPVSVFISRRQQRLYVRKGFEAVFDAPITISQPAEPMGTYVFTAVELIKNGEAFRWNVVALANQTVGKKTFYDTDRSVRAASATLDRIQIPPDVAARVSSIIQTGATVIVTDRGPGSRRSLLPDNDFSVVTR